MEYTYAIERWVLSLKDVTDGGASVVGGWTHSMLLHLEEMRGMLGAAQYPSDYDRPRTFQPGDRILTDPKSFDQVAGDRGAAWIEEQDKRTSDLVATFQIIEHDRELAMLKDAQRAWAERRARDEQEKSASPAEQALSPKATSIQQLSPALRKAWVTYLAGREALGDDATLDEIFNYIVDEEIGNGEYEKRDRARWKKARTDAQRALGVQPLRQRGGAHTTRSVARADEL